MCCQFLASDSRHTTDNHDGCVVSMHANAHTHTPECMSIYEPHFPFDTKKTEHS